MAFGVSTDKGVTWIQASDNQEIWTGYNDSGTWVVNMKYGGTPASITTPPGLDFYGVKMLYPTVQGGRVWNAPLTTGSTRTLRSGQRDGTNDLCPLGSASYTITPSAGEMKMVGDYCRAYVYDSSRSRMFENVEITCYYKSISTTSSFQAGYQGFEMSCRGFHELQKGNDPVKAYYWRHSKNGTLWRLKEDVHPKSYDVSVGSAPFPSNVWLGAKFVVRNMTNGNVKLEGYLDTTDGKDGGTWKKIWEFVDTKGAWGGGSSGLPVYNSTNAQDHSHFVRTDFASDFRIKKWSVREVAPLASL